MANAVAASNESIEDPRKLLDSKDLAEKKKAFQAILRQWIAHV
jgi:hypothetical protein